MKYLVGDVEREPELPPVTITQRFYEDGTVVWLCGNTVIQSGKLYDRCPIIKLTK